MTTTRQRVVALAAHAFTATGAGVGLLALERAFAGDFATCFLWLALALFIDGVDGALARAARVKEHASFIDGDVLDYVIDFLTYVIVPVVALERSGLTPGWLATPLSLAIVVASAVYFGDKRMKTSDHWFRGFPALWNVLIFYMIVFALPAWINVVIVLAAIVLMFAPIVFVHPVRVVQWRAVTVAVLAVWAASAGLALASSMSGSAVAKAGLGLTALYFLALPFARRAPGA